MDCPKRECDGQIEAWFTQRAGCDVDDETGEPSYEFPGPTEMTLEKYHCSQCDANWNTKEELLAERVACFVEGKGGDVDR